MTVGAEMTRLESMLARPAYEPPRVEWVVTPAELEREVLYAGFDFTGTDN